jgi:hypothetical protein
MVLPTVVKGKNCDKKTHSKIISKTIKENGRSNRDEEMNYFTSYYKERFKGTQFKDFKFV